MAKNADERCVLSTVVLRKEESQPLPLRVSDLIIAGWAGKDQEALEKHIRELETLGVARPKSTPVFYRVAASLLTTSSLVDVTGRESTGEVECVLFRHGGELFVGVGSDHTDRKAEAIEVTLSKQMCPKPIASELWTFADVKPHWDELILRSHAIFGGQRVLYQEGSVAKLRAPGNLIELYEKFSTSSFSDGYAMFCGTLGALEKIRWSDSFEIELEDPVLSRKIVHRYEIRALPIEG